MATSSEINSLRNYFTLDDNSSEIICDICTRSYDIEISTEEVKDHLDNVHNDYKGAVSSNTSEEDLKKYYEIKNNTIKCKFCDEKLYIPSRTHTIIKFHLGDGHQLYETITDEISIWLRTRNYRLDKSDENHRCYKCGNICKNKPLSIMNHLRNAHNVYVERYMIPQRLKENKLDSIYDNWVWDFITKINEVYAQCGICNANLNCYKKENKNIRQHLKFMHKNVDVSRGTKEYYSEVQDHQIKCHLCKIEKILEHTYNINDNLEKHLFNHNIKNDQSNTLRNWLFKHINKLRSFQKSQCTICNKTLRKICSFNLIEHLKLHDIEIPPEISSMGKSSDPTGPQAGSSHFPDTSDDNDRYSGMKRVKYDDDKGFSDELPSTSSNILDDGGIAASNIDQQSARDEIFNTSSSNFLNLAAINVLDLTYDIDDDDTFPEIDD